MKSRSARPLILAGFFIGAACCTAQAQAPYLLRIRGTVGHSRSYATTTAIYRLSSSTGEATKDTAWSLMARTRRYWTRTVVAVLGDTLVLSDADDSTTTDLPGPGSIARPVPQVGELTLITKIDGRGRVYAVDIGGLPPHLGAVRDSMRSRLQADARGGGGEPWLPENPVREGDEWADSTRLALSVGVLATRKRTWRFERIDTLPDVRVAVISLRLLVTPDDPSGAPQWVRTKYHIDMTDGWTIEDETTAVYVRSDAGRQSVTKWQTETITLDPLH